MCSLEYALITSKRSHLHIYTVKTLNEVPKRGFLANYLVRGGGGRGGNALLYFVSLNCADVAN